MFTALEKSHFERTSETVDKRGYYKYIRYCLKVEIITNEETKIKTEHKHVRVEYKMLVSLARDTVRNRILRHKTLEAGSLPGCGLDKNNIKV